MKAPQFEKGFMSGIIGDDFTTETVRKCANGISNWMLEMKLKSALVGYDTRFGGALFADIMASTLSNRGIDVVVADSYITSAMLILSIVKAETDLGIIITAGDMSSEYSGIKLKGVRSEEDIDLINKYTKATETHTNFQRQKPVLKKVAAEYISYLRSQIDFKAIQESGLFVVFDAMYGASQSVFTEVLPASIVLRAEHNPTFKGDVPRPSSENIELMLAMVNGTDYAAMGIALDTDGEQVAICDEKGQLINPYELLKNEENIPWRDGLFIGLKLLEKIAISGQKLSELK